MSLTAFTAPPALVLLDVTPGQLQKDVVQRRPPQDDFVDLDPGGVEASNRVGDRTAAFTERDAEQPVLELGPAVGDLRQRADGGFIAVGAAE